MLHGFESHKRELAYILETEYIKLMWDVYTGLCNNEPPYVDAIFLESMRNASIIQLKNNPFSWGSEEQSLFEYVWQDDYGAMIEVLGDKTNSTLDDTLLYLHRNRLSYLKRRSEYTRTNQSIMINSPVVSVW